MERWYSDKDVVKIISLTQAVTKGKTLQTQNGNGGWVDVKDLIVNDLLLYFDRYRIKPEENHTIEQNAGENQIEGGVVSISGSVGKQFCPFKDCDELVKCWEKKMFIPAAMFTEDTRNKLYRPLIWVKSKEYGTDNLITAFDGNNESIGGSCVFIQDVWVDMKELFDNFTFLDGTPCGIIE